MFKSMFNDPKFSDITLRFGTQELFLHKSILATSSEFFANLLLGGFKESTEKFVTIKPNSADEQVVKELIQCIYDPDHFLELSQKLSVPDTFVLYDCADELQVLDVRTKCLNFIKTSINHTTCATVLPLALERGLTSIVEMAQKVWTPVLSDSDLITLISSFPSAASWTQRYEMAKKELCAKDFDTFLNIFLSAFKKAMMSCQGPVSTQVLEMAELVAGRLLDVGCLKDPKCVTTLITGMGERQRYFLKAVGSVLVCKTKTPGFVQDSESLFSLLTLLKFFHTDVFQVVVNVFDHSPHVIRPHLWTVTNESFDLFRAFMTKDGQAFLARVLPTLPSDQFFPLCGKIIMATDTSIEPPLYEAILAAQHQS